MKKFFLLVALMGTLGLTASYAQCSKTAAASTGKSCCASKSAAAATKDASIEKRVSDDGVVSYVRKEADENGNARFVSVEYNETEAKFVNVAPATMAKKSCSPAEKAACNKAEASATQTGGTATKPACCAGKKAASCSSKASTAAKVENQ